MMTYFRLSALAVLAVACCLYDTITGILLYLSGMLLLALAEKSRIASEGGDMPFSWRELPQMAASHALFSLAMLPGLDRLLVFCGLSAVAPRAVLLAVGVLVLPTSLVELFAWLDRRFDLSLLNLFRMSWRSGRFILRLVVRGACLAAAAFVRGGKGFVSGFGDVLKASRPTDDEGDDEGENEDRDTASVSDSSSDMAAEKENQEIPSNEKI